MNITAISLKKICKKLSNINSLNVVIQPDKIFCVDDDSGVIVKLNSGINCSVNSKLFNSTVNKLTKEVEMYQSENSLNLKSGKFKCELPFVNEPTSILPISPESKLTVDAKLLGDILTHSSLITEDIRYDYTGGVQLNIQGCSITGTSTDNHRVSIYTKFTEVTDSFSELIPCKIIKSLKDLEGTTSISKTNNCIFFSTDDTIIFTSKLNKTFPDVSKVIPSKFKLEVGIKTQELLDSLNLITPYTDSDGGKNAVVFLFNGEHLTVKSNIDAIGKAEDIIDIEQIVPDVFDNPITVRLGVNLRFVKNFLTSVKECDTIQFKCNDEKTPFVLEAGDKKMIMAGVRI